MNKKINDELRKLMDSFVELTLIEPEKFYDEVIASYNRLLQIE